MGFLVLLLIVFFSGIPGGVLEEKTMNPWKTQIKAFTDIRDQPRDFTIEKHTVTPSPTTGPPTVQPTATAFGLNRVITPVVAAGVVITVIIIAYMLYKMR